MQLSTDFLWPLVKALIFLLRLVNKIFFAFLNFHKWSHTHTFLLHCRLFVHAVLLPPNYGCCCYSKSLELGFIMATRAQRWWSLKLTRQLFLWLRSLFVKRVEKWRSPRARWKNRPGLGERESNKFSALHEKIHIQEMLYCIVCNSFDVCVIR